MFKLQVFILSFYYEEFVLFCNLSRVNKHDITLK